MTDNNKPESKPGLFKRLRSSLNSGNSWLTSDIGDLLSGGVIDEEFLEDLEIRLLSADVGVDATEDLYGPCMTNLNAMKKQIPKRYLILCVRAC